MQNVIERMRENGTDAKIQMFKVKQALPYAMKLQYAEQLIRDFDRKVDWFVSVGGLDSLTLLLFTRSLGFNPPAISVSVLEDKSIQKIHKTLGIVGLTPAKSKVEVLKEFGFPVISKEVAGKIDTLQHPTEKNRTVRHAIVTGETGAYGGYRTGTRMKLPTKWLNLFAGYENEAEGVQYQIPPFNVSDKCCYYLKEKPCDDYAKQTQRFPMMGLMASEGGRRQKALMINGCNYYGKRTTRSAPFAIFNRQDILQLAIDLQVPIPDIYGQIVRDSNGMLQTTRAQRTGCAMCGFGIHMEKRPHRFDRLREDNLKEWTFWMYEQGWGAVLNYIGVKWEDEYA